MPLDRADLSDLDFFDANELSSDGYAVYQTGTVLSCTAVTKTIVCDIFLYDRDDPAQAGDKVFLSGTSNADGYYYIEQILNQNTFTVTTSINNSTGGIAALIYNSGARLIGFEPETNIPANNVQDAIKYLGEHGGIDPLRHEQLKTLTHFNVQDGYSIITYDCNKLSNYTIYTDSSMAKKIREFILTYTGLKVNESFSIQYDDNGIESYRIKTNFSYNGYKMQSITTQRIPT